MALIAAILRESDAPRSASSRRADGGFDLVGFLLVATFLGALEVVLDRGLMDDWFGSTLHRRPSRRLRARLRADDPLGADAAAIRLIDMRMVATRQFGACLLVMLATGAILLATTQFLPQLVQAEFRLYRDLGRPRAFAGRPRHHGDDVRRRRALGPRCSPNI